MKTLESGLLVLIILILSMVVITILFWDYVPSGGFYSSVTGGEILNAR
jgi:hypothetical protein